VPRGEAKGGGPGRQQTLGTVASGQAAREQGSGVSVEGGPVRGNGRWAGPGKKKSGPGKKK
jgi:hypothetical protein